MSTCTLIHVKCNYCPTFALYEHYRDMLPDGWMECGYVEGDPQHKCPKCANPDAMKETVQDHPSGRKVRSCKSYYEEPS
jgi:hypothetical protein